jgi:hypothetical protein
MGVMLAAVIGFVVMPHVGWRAVLVGSSLTALLAVLARRSMHLPDQPAERAPLSALLSAPVFVRVVRAFVLGAFKLGTYWTCYIWLPGFLRHEMHQSVGRSVAWILTAQVGQLGVGSGCTAGFGALLAELFPNELRTTAMGTTYNLARGIQLGAPVLVGYVVSMYGLAGGLSVPLVLALATAS